MTRIFLAPAFLAVASAASASNPVSLIADNPPTALVNMDDIDVHSNDGRITAERRIDRAAREVCDGLQFSEPVVEPASHKRCYSLALASGVSQLERIVSE